MCTGKSWCNLEARGHDDGRGKLTTFCNAGDPMSGDIEDFLRRAAERRQARQAQKPGPPPARPARPEYSDSRRERTAQWDQDAPVGDEDDAPVVAQQVDTPLARKLAELKRAQAAAQAMRDAAPEDSTAAARDVVAPLRSSVTSLRSGSGAAANLPADGRFGLGVPAAVAAAPPTVLDELRQSLGTAQGLRTAVLLHEILSRPEHRW